MVVKAFVHNGIYHKPTDCLILNFGMGLIVSPLDNPKITIPINNFLLKDETYLLTLIKEDYFKN